jgi:class 3 adenylate cyclase/tetratricopeptide (TPR) repeat protein/predicted Ser/Thr protein kinase
MLCPYCGNELDAYNGVCPRCGPHPEANSAAGELSVAETLSMTDAVTTPTRRADGPALEAGTVLAERFEIIAEIGHGGMGVVYKAHDHALNEIVAVKTLRAESRGDVRLVRRLGEEIRLARKVRHPNVAGVYELGRSESLPFVSMEYVDGVTLRTLIAQDSLPPRERLEVVNGVCRGLEAAHGVGIVHRDLKPQNVMVIRPCRPLILDFGLASLVGREGDATCRFAGTPAYMAPEQFEGRRVGPQTDIYALGVLMYEFFTGRLPFMADTLESFAEKHLHEAPVAPSNMGVALPPGLESIILKALDKSTDRRYRSVQEVLIDLAAVSPPDAQTVPIPSGEDECALVTVVRLGLCDADQIHSVIGAEDMRDLERTILTLVRQSVARYGGEVMSTLANDSLIVFGRRAAHEDDPVRAIKAALEIHEAVRSLGERSGRAADAVFGMRSGVSSGAVLLGGEESYEDVAIVGAAVNRASELQRSAEIHRILVDEETHRLADRFFLFEPKRSARTEDPGSWREAFAVVSPLRHPSTIHCHYGLRASLTGRNPELEKLRDAVTQLHGGQGSVVHIHGAAGTGKSRLIDELKTKLSLAEIDWLEGHAYSYNQTVPYSPLVDLIGRAAGFNDDSETTMVRAALRAWLEPLLPDPDDVLPFIGNLVSLGSLSLQKMSPDYWKARLQESLLSVFAALTQHRRTVICFEDLHWSDPSFLELLGLLLREFANTALFIITQRPQRSLGLSRSAGLSRPMITEVHLGELDPGHTGAMVASLLDIPDVPDQLVALVQERAGGNPLFVEELVNSLAEAGSIRQEEGKWIVASDLPEIEVPPSLQAVIAARIGRLPGTCRRVLQEASVIGRQFDREILKRISRHSNQIDSCLATCERHDLIAAERVAGDNQYRFKHILTRDVAYEGFSHKHRQRIHDRIAEVIEVTHRDRIGDFCEAISYHFRRGLLPEKAVHYFKRSAEKHYHQYALEEAHQSYRSAYDILVSAKGKLQGPDPDAIIDLLARWGFVFHLRGAYEEMLELFNSNRELLTMATNEELRGMYLVWLGWSLQRSGQVTAGDDCLRAALEVGENIASKRVTGYALALRAWTCVEMGSYDAAVALGSKGKEVAELDLDDNELYRMSWTGVGYAKYCQGDRCWTARIGRELLEYGDDKADLRTLTMGHLFLGLAQYIKGDLQASIDCYERAIGVSVDPTFTLNARLALAHSCILLERFEEAEVAISEIIHREEEGGYSYRIQATTARGFLGVIALARGDLEKGKRTIEGVLNTYQEYRHSYYRAGFEHVLGRLYLGIVLREGQSGLWAVIRNLRFLLASVPFAAKRAERHLTRSIDASREIGARCAEAQAVFDLGLLCHTKRRIPEARRHFQRAIRLYEQIDAPCRLESAREALTQL